MALKPFVKKLLGQRSCPQDKIGVDALDRDWTFRSSAPDGVTRLVRLAVARGLVAAPDWQALIPIQSRPRWIVYFVYLPDGRMTLAHRYTLDRLRAADAGLAIVCATPKVGAVPDDLRAYADALYWKALPGFDFSAYTLALHEIARSSPGADVLVLNDSTFGPFVPIDGLWSKMQWDLTGFTASGQIENHIQSYAFHLRNWNADKLRALRSIFPEHGAYDTYRDAVYGQETRFAARAAQSMSVGAFWYADDIRANDPTIFAALPLIEAGFPFLKKALLTKTSHVYGRAEVLEILRGKNHPVDDYAR